GLKYPLFKETLYFASSQGLSNEFTGASAKVTAESGLLLVVKNSR
ncbi:MAG TPA: thiamine diphosphokinase, partial [Firmicutes bacterium]|nr:thiamine diphosphokinase [Bacillota bacterium]